MQNLDTNFSYCKIFMQGEVRGGPRSVMVTPLTCMQEVRGSNPSAAPPSLEPTSPIPRLQVAKMRQGSLKGMAYAKAEHPG